MGHCILQCVLMDMHLEEGGGQELQHAAWQPSNIGRNEGTSKLWRLNFLITISRESTGNIHTKVSCTNNALGFMIS